MRWLVVIALGATAAWGCGDDKKKCREGQALRAGSCKLICNFDADCVESDFCLQGVCTPITCGNGRIEPGEECDDGDSNAASALCTPECKDNVCGDGHHRPIDEECDDGNVVGRDGCTADCLDEAGLCLPDPETCDGNDNDCDGSTDEDLVGGLALNQEGVCFGSTQACIGGVWDEPPGNVITDFESPESACDNKDNDCDAIVDEGCGCIGSEGTQGVCALATISDTTGTCTVPSSYASPETASHCDGDDNDCDGATDESCPCNYQGDSDGVCATAVRDNLGACDTAPPGHEASETICDDSLDNDCDTVTDEGCQCDYLGDPQGVCNTASINATTGVCDAPLEYEDAEITLDDNLDNDCDGLTDVNYTALNAYFKMDENAGDLVNSCSSIPTASDCLTLVGAGTLESVSRGPGPSPPAVPGIMGNGYNFATGATSRVHTIGTVDDFSYLFHSDETWTINAWIKLDSAPPLAQQVGILSQQITSLSSSYGLDIRIGVSGRLACAIGNGTSPPFFNSTSFGEITDTDWHMVSVSYSQFPSAEVSLYIDGVLDSAQDTGTGVVAGSASSTLEIGNAFNQGAGGNYNFPGTLDEMSIWDRQLNAAEILMLYSQGAALNLIP